MLFRHWSKGFSPKTSPLKTIQPLGSPTEPNHFHANLSLIKQRRSFNMLKVLLYLIERQMNIALGRARTNLGHLVACLPALKVKTSVFDILVFLKHGYGHAKRENGLHHFG